MLYMVSVTLRKEVHEGNTPEEAKEKFLQHFIFGDLDVGDWKIELMDENNWAELFEHVNTPDEYRKENQND